MRRVEVVLCTYNGAAFLRAQLQSLADQSTPAECVTISDDGSSDATVEISRSFKGRLNVQLSETESRLGATGNFSRALSQARGELILLCDQDDIWHSNKIERLLGEMAQYPEALLIHSDARIIDRSGTVSDRTLFSRLLIPPNEFQRYDGGDVLAVLLRRNVVTGCTAALRRRLLDDALPIPDGYWHDEWLALIAAAVGTIRRIDEPLIDYRVHSQNQAGLRGVAFATRFAAATSKRGDHHAERARKLDLLAGRLRSLGPRVPADRLRLVEECRRHWHERASLPRKRLLRIPIVWRNLKSGAYSRFSAGWRSAQRDLFEQLP
jgi:glycosyltransferase involved in cell wall biosynthesis